MTNGSKTPQGLGTDTPRDRQIRLAIFASLVKDGLSATVKEIAAFIRGWAPNLKPAVCMAEIGEELRTLCHAGVVRCDVEGYYIA